MDVLQEFLNQAIAKVPALLLEKVIARKLKEQGIAGKGLSRKLADHVLSGKREPLKFRSSKHTGSVTLDFNETDADEITQAADRFCETQLPKLLVNMAAKTSRTILKDLKSRWATENSLQSEEISEFRKRLERRWGEPLDQLRMLLTVSREWFEGRHKREISQTAHKDEEFREIIARLLARACQVTDEIICLLENGFADGAMARWRTLHEIAVVSAVISQHGSSIAERYVAHQAVESKRALDKHMECYKKLGEKPIPQREQKKILKAYDSAIARYGKAFKYLYGWAAFHLQKEKPTFANLEEEAGRAEMRPYYQLGSDNVHAGVKSMFFRLGLIENYTSMLAGRSNAGLAEPGQHAAHTLTQLAILICLSDPTFDDLVTAEIMKKLRDEILYNFYRVDKRLLKDDRSYRATLINGSGAKPSDF
ncbi:MAG: DUF5677 domain-containing protein [Terriglobales bacterium]